MPSLADQAQAIANLYVPPPTGRPSDIGSPSTVTQFLEAVGDGNYIETAAKLAGLSKQVVYNWIKRGQAGETPFDVFVDALEKAEARAEADAVRNVRQAGKLPQFWAAEMTYLERRHPEKWGKRQDTEQGPKVLVQVGGGSGNVQVNVAFAPQVSTDSLCKSGLSGDLESNKGELCQPGPRAELPAVAVSAEPENPIPAQAFTGGPRPGGRRLLQPKVNSLPKSSRRRARRGTQKKEASGSA